MNNTAEKIVEEFPESNLWYRAAVVGGFWASFEIIIGSFLHNMRLPFAGSVLTMLGIIFLIAFHRYWPLKGLIWRAGLICALMKSVSPSAVILGPMTGILTEALVLEGVIMLLGANRISYLLGGILVMFVTLIHKIITLLIYYGFNLVVIFERFYEFAARQLQLEGSTAWNLLALLFVLYALFGVIAAVLAMRIRIGEKQPEKKVQERPQARNISERFNLPAVKRYSTLLLLFHLILILSGIYFLNVLPLIWGATIVLLYSLLCFAYYKGILNRLKRPALWLQLAGVIVLASFFIDNLSNQQDGISLFGFLEGLEMTLRALLVFIGFSAISIEIRNPIVKTFLENRGLRGLYHSLSLAFGILPFLVERLSRPSLFLRKPGVAISGMIAEAENWLRLIEKK